MVVVERKLTLDVDRIAYGTMIVELSAEYHYTILPADGSLLKTVTCIVTSRLLTWART